MRCSARLAVLAIAAVAGPATAQEPRSMPAPSAPAPAASPPATGLDPALGQRLASAGNPNGAPPCSQCHGEDGAGSAAGGFPRLAGQPAHYLYKQLDDYASGRRDNPIMTPIAQALSDAERQSASAYYASLNSPYPAAPAIAPAARQTAANLVAWGSLDQRVQGCRNCHGPNATGLPLFFPQLAGQLAAYTRAQLEAFRNGSRQNDVSAVMRNVAGSLTDADIAALSTYLEALRPGEAAPSR